MMMALAGVFVNGKGCGIEIRPTIYDDNDCKDVNTAVTNLYDSSVTDAMISQMNTCEHVDRNGATMDVEINCDTQYMNFTVFNTTDNTCKG